MENFQRRKSRGEARPHRRRRKIGIRARLFLLVLTAMAPFVVLVVLGIRKQIVGERAAGFERALGQARTLAAQVDSEVNSVESMLSSISAFIAAGQKSTVSMSGSDQIAMLGLQSRLLTQRLTFKAFTPSQVLFGATDSSGVLTAADLRWLREIDGRRSPLVELVRAAKAGDRPKVAIVQPLTDAVPGAGAIVATMDFFPFDLILNSALGPPGWEIALVNERNQILAQNRGPVAPDGERSPATGQLAANDAGIAENPAGWVFVACRKAPWRVYVAIPKLGLMAALQLEYGWTVLAGLAAIVTALALAGVIGARITKPISQLAADARIFSMGDTRHRSAVRSKSELGSLSRTFNRMLDGLERRDRDLRASEARYRNLIENTSEAIVVLDVEKDSFIDHNVEAERLFKLEGEGLRHANFVALSPPRQPDGRPSFEAIQTLLQQAIDGGAPIFEWLYRDSDGEEIPCEMRLLRLAGEHRVLVRGSIISRSDRKQSERRLEETLALQRAILNHAGYAIISTTPEGFITTFNPAAEQLLGYEASEVMGRHAAQLIHDPDEVAAQTQALSPELGEMIAPGFEVFMARAKTGGPGEQEWTYIRKDGGRVSVQLAVTALVDGAGQTTGFIGMAVDITERRRAEAQLAHERTVLELIARGTPQDVVLIRLVKEHESLFPGTLGSVQVLDESGRHFARMVAPSLPEEFIASYAGVEISPLAGSCGAAAFTGKTVIASDVTVDPRWENFRAPALKHGLRACWATPIRSGQGAILGTFALYYREAREPLPRELDAIIGSAQLAALAIERRQAEVARGELERKMLETQKMESLGVLAGGIAHDFNNLLTGILGYSSLAEMELTADSPIREYMAQINRSSTRAADLCKQMLAYAGRGRFLVQDVDLSRVTEGMAQLLTVSIGKEVTLNLELAADLPLIEGDESQIRQVVTNLVVNASEALGGRKGTIAIRTTSVTVNASTFSGAATAPESPPKEFVRLEISDDAGGMSAETRSRIFDPFFTTKFAGRGLGLAAVLGIMRSHAGALKVESEPGRGTTFQLFFPCKPQPQPGGEPKIVSLAEKPWRGEGTVMVVEDEESIRTTMIRSLKALGFETAAVADGREALRLLRAAPSRFAAVLLDLTLPGMDGEQTFAEMRLVRPDVRVILMSGLNQQESVARFAGRGLANFLQKPVSPPLLERAIRAVLEVRDSEA